MISHAGHTISYDALGNPLNRYNNIATFSNITWEGRRLTGMTVGSTAFTYSYNSDGIRTKKQNGSNVVEYLYDDAGNLVEEKHSGYSLYFIYDDSNELIGFKVSNGGTYYYGKDVFGVIKYIYNASGTIVGTYTYDAWGNTISSTGTTDTNLNPIRYKDYYFDTESGFYYLQSRYYDPQVGRFISADDTGYLGATGTVLSLNLFSYCYNNSVIYYDPSGYFAAVGVIATQSVLTILSNYLAGLIASLSASIASIQSALMTCWVPIVCISLTAVAVASIALIVKKSIDLQSHAKSIRASVDKVITNGGVDPKKEGDNSVYIIVRKKDNEVVYVGRTSNFKTRSSYHRRTRFPEKAYNIFIVKTGLSLKESRVLEQSLITAYGLDTLKNMINSISPKKWNKFKDEFDRMLKLLGAFYDPE